MRRLQVAISTIGVAAVSAAPAFAQNGDHTNLSHFYMARQQIDILDDAPAVNDMRSQPGAAAAQRSTSGALPNRPIALPRAGFMPYSQNLPSVQSSLPKTFNGVPPKAPPMVNPNMAKAGAFKAPKPAAPQAPPGPKMAKRYSPYRGYGGDSPGGAVVGGGGHTYAAGGASSSTALHGTMLNQPMSAGASALHWSRTRNPQ